MRRHELKTWTEPFEAVLSGEKTWEFRRDDRGFTVGDELVLQHWDPGARKALGHGQYVRAYGFDGPPETIFARVTYILHGGRFGIPEGFCVMSIEVTGKNFERESERGA